MELSSHLAFISESHYQGDPQLVLVLVLLICYTMKTDIWVDSTLIVPQRVRDRDLDWMSYWCGKCKHKASHPEKKS